MHERGSDGHGKGGRGSGDPAEGSRIESPVERLGLADDLPCGVLRHPAHRWRGMQCRLPWSQHTQIPDRIA